ncbi:HNH endonuclease [Lysobacter sp. F6437]|uniref:HNH endonuclease n=1 Tax=Lysobacter sp. F6437 TaxID=3459296 RepID=UPI00403D9506
MADSPAAAIHGRFGSTPPGHRPSRFRWWGALGGDLAWGATRPILARLHCPGTGPVFPSLSESGAVLVDVPFKVGALYHRRDEIHARFGGQRQGGISTPKDSPVVIMFTGEAGVTHGYHDFWDDDGVLHYFGEGQVGDMTYSGGNRAILRHDVEGKVLLLFQMMGKGQPYRFLGEFQLASQPYEKAGVPDTRGDLRKAIVFPLRPVLHEVTPFEATHVGEAANAELELGSTVTLRLGEVRKKQSLFRRRLIGVEKECRLTGVRDLRFLRASHIKPWAECGTAEERVDGHNGLLLTPTADLLFDRGWITFEDKGALVPSQLLPDDVAKRIGFSVRSGRRCGAFTQPQSHYLEYHRNKVFEKKLAQSDDPVATLMETLSSQPGYPGK